MVAGDGGLRILRQQDGGRFVDVTATARLPASIRTEAQWGVWVADIDAEGGLDIVVFVWGRLEGRVLRDDGDGTFAAMKTLAGLENVRHSPGSTSTTIRSPTAWSWRATGTLQMSLNLRSGQFQEGRRTNIAPATGRTSFTEAAGRGRFGANLDNNGATDLVITTPTTTEVRLSAPSGTAPLQAPLPFAGRRCRRSGWRSPVRLVGVDKGGAPVVAKNRGTKALSLPDHPAEIGHGARRPAHQLVGIGGEVEIRTGLHAQRISITSPIVHIGLGQATRAEVARIFWPNGTIQSESSLTADTTIAASQRLKGSCPWLFAWNGREMALVTDLIWRSPLGLRINAQATADIQATEDWVKVRGDQLAARDGAYDLRVTAELWETHFFDRLALGYVDHPAGTEVFVDERFAVPAPPLDLVATDPVRAFAVRAGRSRARRRRRRRGARRPASRFRRPRRVSGHHARSLRRDGRARGGAARGPLWLIGHGWVHPTDSSVNVAISQGAHAAPRSLSLHIADASGTFRQARAGLGFPSGKDKTVRIDLAGSSRRPGPGACGWQRISKCSGTGWDGRRAGRRSRPRMVLLPLRSADLRYRGYSVTERIDTSTPERPRYTLAGTAPRWPDLEGYHTRFGDVMPLVTATDDRYVIMNAGDELALRFELAPPVPPGMARDFVVIGDGWVKDGDFNTTFSRTVLPLPTHASGRYDRRRPGHSRPIRSTSAIALISSGPTRATSGRG